MGTKGKLHAHGKTIKRLLDLLEIILGTLRVGLHGGFAWLPVGGANFAMLFYKLQGIKNTNGFINATAQRQIVDQKMANIK